MSRRTPAAVRARQRELARRSKAFSLSARSVHWTNLDALCRPGTTPQDAVDWAESLMTWSRAVQLMGRHDLAEALARQMGLANELLMRAKAGTLSHLTDADEVALVHEGADLMDRIANETPAITRAAAAVWCESYFHQLSAETACEGKTL